ncbi:hypothetical protein T05_2320 [Trichinella murrelli]|uniref:Uncharacterized protein n=1 Tax=Trichinella murrelli TaxID=144512 RepID=A0A0V0TA57_9BILA|nr:hypothetical protein T05_2320 [Trichinella murrelli]
MSSADATYAFESYNIIGCFKRALTHVKVYETPYSSTSDVEITCEPNSIEKINQCENEMVSHL